MIRRDGRRKSKLVLADDQLSDGRSLEQEEGLEAWSHLHPRHRDRHQTEPEVALGAALCGDQTDPESLVGSSERTEATIGNGYSPPCICDFLYSQKLVAYPFRLMHDVMTCT